MPGRWGPDGRQAAVSLTFDNLGEASDLEFSRWPPDWPVGQHHSVLRDLPAILDVLEVRATFFIETWNLPIYPAAIRALQEAGHEIACHGMRHEMWGMLTPEQELDHITRCQQDFARHGLELRGLRPPGGALTPASGRVLAEAGLHYVSPVSVPSGVLGNGLCVLECDLAAGDVAFYSPAFTRHRRYKPGPDIASPADLVEGIIAEVDKTIATGGYLALLCHPHLQSPTSDRTDPERIEAIAEIARRLSADRRLWFDSCAAVADWMQGHANAFPPPPSLDPPAWWDPAAYQKVTRDHGSSQPPEPPGMGAIAGRDLQANHYGSWQSVRADCSTH